jgi:hypothetical protein
LKINPKADADALMPLDEAQGEYCWLYNLCTPMREVLVIAFNLAKMKKGKGGNYRNGIICHCGREGEYGQSPLPLVQASESPMVDIWACSWS